MIIIKKYQNRRMYDAANKQYIRLEKIIHLIKEDIPFQVIDVKSGSDITQFTLQQVILENNLLNLQKFDMSTLKMLISSLSEKSSDSFYAMLKNIINDFYSNRSFTQLSQPEYKKDHTPDSSRLTRFWQALTSTENDD